MLPSPAMVPTRSITPLLALACALVLLVVACTREAAPLPVGDDLLQAAAAEMRGVSSVAFDLEVAGPLGDLAIQRANGVLTREGDASGAVTMDAAGTPVEYEVVISGGQVYLKGPTADFRALPSAFSDSVYNPAKLLNPSGGLAEVLNRTGNARTEAAEAVAGAQAYRVSATIDAQALEGLLPVQLEEGEVPATLWIGQDRPVLLRARLAPTLQGEDEPTTMTVTLSDFNATVDITPPPT